LFRILCSAGFQWRPAQALYLTLVYKAFGVHPLGYHIANAVLLATAVYLFYLALSILGQSRFLAIAVPLVYMLLSNYSTNRVWLVVPGNLCMAFCALNLYALLRTAQTRGSVALAWAALSLVALVASALAWEIAMPLLVVNVLLAIWMRPRNRSATDSLDSSMGLRLAVAGNLVALALLGIFKTKSAVRFHAERLSLSWVKYVLKGAVRVHLIDYGVRLPKVLYLALRLNPNWESYVLAVLLGFSILWYLKSASDAVKIQTKASDMYKFIACGLVVFATGNAIFLLAPGEVGSTDTGVGNRINIAASVGVAMIFVGSIRVLSTLNTQQSVAQCYRTFSCRDFVRDGFSSQ
jgi:hypothetical protein